MNEKIPILDDGKEGQYRFGGDVRPCRGTNLVFSAYDDGNMQNKVKFAFLGIFADTDISEFRINSCNAKTRYEFDSQCEGALSLLKDKHYQDSRYVDEDILSNGFNSYDSMDKFAMVVEFDTPIDNKTLFDSSDSI